MKTKAALAVEAGKPLEIVNVNLDGPKDKVVFLLSSKKLSACLNKNKKSDQIASFKFDIS